MPSLLTVHRTVHRFLSPSLSSSRPAAWLGSLFLILALVACGGGGSSEPANPQQPPATVVNSAPQAVMTVLDGGSSASAATVGTPLRIDASASRDVDGDALSYAWTLSQRPAGSAAVLADLGGGRVSLVPDVAGDYRVELTLGDGAGGHVTQAALTVQAVAPAHWLVTLDHGAFRLLYDCDDRTALRYDYTLTVDTGTAARPDNFTLNDPTLPVNCGQQTSAASYASVVTGWDRGHLVTANHMDRSDADIAATNHMTNVVPQRSAFNQGIWLQAENVAECYRDLAPVRVVGGVVYDDSRNDLFLTSHGIRTPDWFWKAIVTTDAATGATRAIAWLIPNDTGLGPLDGYLVSIDTLEARVGAARVGLDTLSADLKAQRPATTWALPARCNLG